MAELIVGPVMEKLISTCFEYLKDQFSMNDTLERLRDIHPKIQAFVSAASQAQIIDQNPNLNKWIWQLRDAIDEAEDLLDLFEYMKHEKQLAKEGTKVSSILYHTTKRFRKSYPSLKRLKKVVEKLDKVSADFSIFLHLIESIKQEQQVELHKTRETGSLPKNDLISQGENKEFVIQWLRQPSHVTTSALYRNISLLQHVYAEEITKKFNLKMWFFVSYSFDVKKVIAYMLESINQNRPSLESLDALQESLKSKVMSKKFLLILDKLWDKEEEEEEEDAICCKWENVLDPLAY